MASKNPLGENSIPREQVSGESIINNRTERIMRVPRPNGETEAVIIEAREAAPAEDGTYVDRVISDVATDSAGNTLNDLSELVAISWSGIFIKSPEERAICGSWLHPPNLSRNILLGQDGHHTNANGYAICTGCSNRLSKFYLVAGIIALAVLIGIFKGAYSVVF